MDSKEGDVRIVTQKFCRHECETCGEPATKEHTYLMPNARNNPASSGYGKDDISWCSDFKLFSCDDCSEKNREENVPDGYRWVATFSFERFEHLFFFWNDISTEQVNSQNALT